MRYVVVALCTLFASGCASSEPPRSAVVMKISNQEAHVRLGKDRVVIGDDLVIRRKYCEPDPERGKSAQKLDAGHRPRTRDSLRGRRYSVVHVYEGGFAEGDLVERAPAP